MMFDNPDFEINLEEWTKLYKEDREEAHREEDNLIRNFVIWCAERGSRDYLHTERVADEVVRLIAADFPKWYA